MLSKLVNEAGPDGKMTVREAATNGTLLLTAGHDSTVNTISHCVLTVLRNPGTFELLRSRPELVPGAIEEVLRLESAVQFFPVRSALADIEIKGTVIPKGSPVHLIYAAATATLRSLTTRTNSTRNAGKQHMGGRGFHTCFGGPLARLEVTSRLRPSFAEWRTRGSRRRPPPYPQSNSSAARDTY